MNTAVPGTEVVQARGGQGHARAGDTVLACPARAGQFPRPCCRAAEPAVPTRLPECLPTRAAGSAQVRCTTLGWAIYSSAESLLRQQI